jgi:hypothetical protein
MSDNILLTQIAAVDKNVHGNEVGLQSGQAFQDTNANSITLTGTLNTVLAAAFASPTEWDYFKISMSTDIAVSFNFVLNVTENGTSKYQAAVYDITKGGQYGEAIFLNLPNSEFRSDSSPLSFSLAQFTRNFVSGSAAYKTLISWDFGKFIL